MRHVAVQVLVSAALSAMPAAVAFAGADSGDPDDIRRLEMEKTAKAAHEARLAAAGGAGEGEPAFSRVGVVARRAAPGGAWRVEVEAFSTGLASGAIVEFPLVTLNSGHEYEALFQTAAKASDIRDAFSFVGLEPGLPASPSAFRFWPRGELVAAEVFAPDADPVPGTGRTLASFLVGEGASGKPPRTALYAYVGAGGRSDVDDAGPGSVVSSYNEASTLLDVPRLAAQGDVYGTVLSAPDVPPEAFGPVKIVFSPEPRRPEWPSRRVRDVALRLSDGGLSVDGAPPRAPADAAKALSAPRAGEGRDSFVSFSWDPGVRLRDVAAAARLLASLEEAEDRTGVRIDAPPDGFPYFKAFLPPDEWRDRAKRFSQPCELRFGAEGTPPVLVRIDEKWGGDSLEPELSAEDVPLSGPDALPGLLKIHSPENLRVLLVFAPSGATWGELAPWLEAARPTHPLVQIFLD